MTLNKSKRHIEKKAVYKFGGLLSSITGFTRKTEDGFFLATSHKLTYLRGLGGPC